MNKAFALLMTAACLSAFLTFAPAAPGQSPEAEAKVIAVAQQLKLTPQQDVQVLPILKAEAPKFEAIKNNPSLRAMQKVRQLRAIHAETAPQLQKILVPRSIKSSRPSAMRPSTKRSRQSGRGANSSFACNSLKARRREDAKQRLHAKRFGDTSRG